MKIFINLVLLLFSVSVLAQKPVQITDCETVKKWVIRKNTSYVKTKWPDGNPGYCGKLTLDKFKQGQERWPGILWEKPNLKVTDWTCLTKLQLTIFSEQSGFLRLYAKSVKNGKVAKLKYNIPLQKGRNSIEIPVSAFSQLDLANIAAIHFFYSRPEKKKVYYISDIVGFFENVEVKLQEFFQKAQELRSVNFSSLPDSQRAELNKLLKELKNFETKLKSLKAKPSTEISMIIDKANDVIVQLKSMVDMAAVCRFQRAPQVAAAWVSGTEKVFRDKQVFLTKPQKITKISLAKNEQEGAQLVLLPLQDLKNVKVNIADTPVSSSGKKILNTKFSIAPVCYVYCEKPRYFTPRIGYHPDPVMEYLKKMNLDRLKYQAYYLKIRSSKNTAAGTYRGKISVSAQGMKEIKIPFEVKIFNFTIPSGTPYPLALSRWSTYLGQKDPHGSPENMTPAQKAYTEKCLKIFPEYRLSPDDIYRNVPPTVEEAKKILANKGGWFNIIYVRSCGPDQTGKYPQQHKERILRELKRVIPLYHKAGILDRAYIYAYDEAGKAQLPAIKDILKIITKLYPDIPILTTTQDSSYGIEFGLDKYIDIWCPITSKIPLTVDARKKALARGKQIWWYTCCSPEPPYANVFIECPNIDSRLLMGMMIWRYKIQGFLFYSMALWRKYYKTENGSWNFKLRDKYISGGPLTNWDGNSWCDCNGDGNWIYPAQEGPVPSLRMYAMNDGFEDYFYLQMLKDKIDKVKNGKLKLDKDWLKRAEKALAAPDRLVVNLVDYTRDPAKLNKARNDIAKLLEESTTK